MNPKPKKGAYDRKRKRERRAADWRRWYGSSNYVAAVHRHTCLVMGSANPTPCLGPMEAAHVEKKTRPGITWRDIVPLCRQHHNEQEGATASFEAKYGLDLADAAMRYTNLHGHLVDEAHATKG